MIDIGEMFGHEDIMPELVLDNLKSSFSVTCCTESGKLASVEVSSFLIYY